jgi:hypothetical protein
MAPFLLPNAGMQRSYVTYPQIPDDRTSYRGRPCSPHGTLVSLLVTATLLAACADTPRTADAVCTAWRTRVETVRVCNQKGMQCAFEEQSVPYCVRTGVRRAGAGVAAVSPETAPPRSPLKAVSLKRTAENDGAPTSASAAQQPRTQGERNAKGRSRSTPDLDRFWRSIYAASRYKGMRYGRVQETIRDPATLSSGSARVVAALRKNVNTVVVMEVASDSDSTPVDHRLTAVVYQAHNAEAAGALYAAIVRDEWREKKRLGRRGVKLVVVNTGDRKQPDTNGQRIHLLRGSYVLDIDEWKSMRRDASGKPVPGKALRLTPPVSPDAVARAATVAFPAK